MTSVPQVQKTALDYYVITKGVPLGAAIALVSVLYYESKLNTGSQGYQQTETPGVLNPHGAYGIASWNGPRQKGLLDFATTHNLLVSALDTQLAFVLTEIANRYPNCWAAIRSTASYQGVISVLVDEYENPKNKPAEINGALAIAVPLSALPPPQPASPAPIPQAPAHPVPIPTSPHPAVPAGLPPMSGMEAGMDAALRDYMGNARDTLVTQRAAIDKRIAWIDASIEEFGKLNPEPTTQLSLSPVLSPTAAESAATTTEGTQNMPPAIQSIINMLFGNWKTTLSGVVTAASHGVAVAYPEYAGLANTVTTAGLAALGITATDAKTPK